MCAKNHSHSQQVDRPFIKQPCPGSLPGPTPCSGPAVLCTSNQCVCPQSCRGGVPSAGCHGHSGWAWGRLWSLGQLPATTRPAGLLLPLQGLPHLLLEAPVFLLDLSQLCPSLGLQVGVLRGTQGAERVSGPRTTLPTLAGPTLTLPSRMSCFRLLISFFSSKWAASNF